MWCRIYNRKRPLLVALVAISVLVYLYLFQSYDSGKEAKKQPAARYDQLPFSSFAIDTTTCKIPDFDPWHKPSIRFVDEKFRRKEQQEPRCGRKKVSDWFYANVTHLIANLTAIDGDGYSWSGLRCCYQVIERVEQKLINYNRDADNIVRLSAQCHELPEYANPIRLEFIKVFCKSPYLGLLKELEHDVYHDRFAFAQMDAPALKKVSRWEGVPLQQRPPNVILFGIDTNSRLNSHRQMNKTLKLLGELGAVEMFGYTKVGTNTFSNMIGFFTATTELEMKPVCISTYDIAQDGCPYIWKDFDRAGYLTAVVEDVSLTATFNYKKTGFVQKPTDFYYRPFVLGTMQEPEATKYYLKCIGRRRSDQVQLTYLSDILKMASGQAPVFTYFWSTTYTHACIHGASYLDAPMAHFLEGNVKSLTNTVLFFMSDHGDGFGKFRKTTLGWYEDKLPSMWIYMSPDLREKFPDWTRAIQLNAKRLTSHFDLYHTMIQILATYNKNLNFDESYGRRHPPPRHGQTLLEPIPENRTCEEAGIPAGNCACKEPQIMDVKSENPVVQKILKKCASTAIKYLENVLPPACSTPVLKEIVSAKYFNEVGGEFFIAKQSYVLNLITEPGDFLFEARVRAKINIRGEGKYSVENFNDILRINEMERKADCVDSPVIEKYCYCP